MMSAAVPELQQRRTPMAVPERHFVNGAKLKPPYPAGFETAVFGRGCFWGVEKRFWELDGVYSTAAGYAGGSLVHPTYREVCGGDTGHAEVVLVVFDPEVISYEALLGKFWDGHNPTRGFRQGYDIGSQYRSVIIASTDAQLRQAIESREHREKQLILSGRDRISTEIEFASPFYFAEARHQQYLARQ